MRTKFSPLQVVASLVLAATLARADDSPVAGYDVTVDPDATVSLSDGTSTLARVAYPSVAVPAGGWPIVVVCHGGGGDRLSARPEKVAAWGYLAVSYDARGANEGPIGRSLGGTPEVMDLAEVVAWTRSTHAARTRPDRLAVTGFSYGGQHAWLAAASSDRVISWPGRGTLVFPHVDAAIPMCAPGDLVEHLTPGGALVSTFPLGALDDPDMDPALVAAIEGAITADDPALLRTALTDDWGFGAQRDGLGSTTTAILARHPLHDALFPQHTTASVLGALPAGTPWRLVTTSGGHGAPKNAYEEEDFDGLRRRWLRRFLWDEANGVDLEPRATLGCQPLALADYEANDHLWTRRVDAAFPAPDAPGARLFLGADGALATTAGAALAGGVTLTNTRLDPQWDGAAFLADPALSTVVTKLASSAHAFQTAPLAVTSELGGFVRVRLTVVPDHPSIQVAATLEALPPVGAPVLLAHGASGLTGATPGVQRTLSLIMGPTGAIVPAGWSLRVTLRNYWVVSRPGKAETLEAVPSFHEWTSLIVTGAPNGSRLELPLRAALRAGLTASAASVDDAAPATLTVTIDAGTARAGSSFRLALGDDGQTPGVLLGGATLAVAAPWLASWTGTLDASGRAVVTVDPALWLPTPLTAPLSLGAVVVGAGATDGRWVGLR